MFKCVARMVTLATVLLWKSVSAKACVTGKQQGEGTHAQGHVCVLLRRAFSIILFFPPKLNRILIWSRVEVSSAGLVAEESVDAKAGYVLQCHVWSGRGSRRTR